MYVLANMKPIVEIDTNTAPFIQAMFKEVAKDIETPCYIRRKFARKGYNIPEVHFLKCCVINSTLANSVQHTKENPNIM